MGWFTNTLKSWGTMIVGIGGGQLAQGNIPTLDGIGSFLLDVVPFAKTATLLYKTGELAVKALTGSGDPKTTWRDVGSAALDTVGSAAIDGLIVVAGMATLGVGGVVAGALVRGAARPILSTVIKMGVAEVLDAGVVPVVTGDDLKDLGTGAKNLIFGAPNKQSSLSKPYSSAADGLQTDKPIVAVTKITPEGAADKDVGKTTVAVNVEKPAADQSAPTLAKNIPPDKGPQVASATV